MPRLRLNRQPTIITRADRARAAGQWQLAAGLYRVALDRTPHNPPIWIQYGHALKECGNPGEAEAAYRTALAYEPADADAHLQLGHTLKLQGKRDEAEAAYRQAWLLDPSSSDAARELAPFGWTKERLVTAASHPIAAPAPEVASAETTVNGPVSRSAGRRAREGLITRADRAQSAGQWRLAARLYRKALDRNPDNPPIWVQYGHALKESGDPAEAERAYRAALSYAPGVADTHLQLGHVLKLQGKTEEAQAAYLRSFALENRQRDSLDELAGLGWASMQLSELTQILPLADSDTSINGISTNRTVPDRGNIENLRSRISASGLFEPEVYMELHEDVRNGESDALSHYIGYGCREGRSFTSLEVVARLLAQLNPEIEKASGDFRTAAEFALRSSDTNDALAWLRGQNLRIAVLCNSEGNFFMREIADLLTWGLQLQGMDTVQRDQRSDRDERFDLRIFVAPHEFFFLGEGKNWTDLVSHPGSVLYNVEQVQTQWFALTFLLLLKAPLVLDINFQTVEILRRAGVNAVHFMPGHLSTAAYAQPCFDISEFELVQGYDFARARYNWRERDRLDDRPIDVLFIGSATPRRDQALSRLKEVVEGHRFLCVCTRQEAPLTARSNRATSTVINCALGQRAKIVLNIHRDWLGYFEWSRMVLQGFWQGACVVSDPSLSNPIFDPGTHYLEENPRHVGELVRWLLETADGREKLDKTRRAGYERACRLGSMNVALVPVFTAFRELLTS